MIRIAEINAFNFGSTGNIMYSIALIAGNQDFEVKTFAPSSRMNKKNKNETSILFGTIGERRICERIARIFPLHDCLNYLSTSDLLSYLHDFKPDILHFHNLHGDYLNLKKLFAYAKENEIKIVWTFHDCWPLTGHCTYFTYVKCDRWKYECKKCPQYKNYPISYFDDSFKMYKTKKDIFTSVPNCVIVTPSKWLKNIVCQSFLSKYPVKVINNGIDLNIFKPTYGEFIKEYNIKNKYIILGVAFLWDKRKGIDRFINIAQKLPNNFQVILVGTLYKKMNLGNIIHIQRTENAVKLAEIYTAANVFVNPTYEDNFPTVNIEALACGTPVLTYDTGGSAEIIDDKYGAVVDDNTVVQTIKSWCLKDKPVSACLKRASQFNAMNTWKGYLKLYKEIMMN